MIAEKAVEAAPASMSSGGRYIVNISMAEEAVKSES